jgi:hypothetical protein
MSTRRNDKVATLKDRLIGTWALVSAERVEIASGKRTAFLGTNPIGFLHYMPDGRMLALMTRAGRRAPAGNVATAAEAEALMRSMIAYGGTYECAGDEVTHHCDISWNESFTGTLQKRTVTFEGDRLILSPPASPDPTDGMMSLHRVTWRRL